MNYFRVSKNRISTITIFIYLCFFLGFIVFFQSSIAYGGSRQVLSAWAYVTPNIDGILKIGEWEDADSLSFKTPEPQGIDCIVYVKNDGSNIYFAVRTTDSTLSQGPNNVDSVMFLFDNDNDGFGPEHRDDQIGWTGGQIDGFRDGFCNHLAGVFQTDFSDGGTTDGLASVTGNGTYNFFEFSHPLDSDDDIHDFNLSLGDTVGFSMGIMIDGFKSGSFPPYSKSSDWLKIEVARAPDEPKPEPEPRESPQIDYTQVIVALIGLVGTIFTAFFAYRLRARPAGA